MYKIIDLKFEKCRENITIPEYKTKFDSGLDVRATDDVIIYPGETKIIQTGLKFNIPEGYEIQARPRSGISLNTPLRITNTPGTIDSPYKDEVGIMIENTSRTLFKEVNYNINGYELCILQPFDKEDYKTYTLDEKGNKPGIYKISKGDRIAQLVLMEVRHANLIEVPNGTVKTLGLNRGGGFGHTGVK